MSIFRATGQELARFSNKKLTTMQEKFAVEVNDPAKSLVFDLLNRLGFKVSLNRGSSFIRVSAWENGNANKITEFVDAATNAEITSRNANNVRYTLPKGYYQALASLYSNIVQENSLGRIELDLEASTIDINFHDEDGPGILQLHVLLLSNAYNSGLPAINKPAKTMPGVVTRKYTTNANEEFVANAHNSRDTSCTSLADLAAQVKSGVVARPLTFAGYESTPTAANARNLEHEDITISELSVNTPKNS